VFCDGDLFAKNTSCHCVLGQSLFPKKYFISQCFVTKVPYVPTPVAETIVKINKMLYLARYLAP
jgi:hypothetical protein